MKAAGTWGPSLGIPVKWAEKQIRRQVTRRRRRGVSPGSSATSQQVSAEDP